MAVALDGQPPSKCTEKLCGLGERPTDSDRVWYYTPDLLTDRLQWPRKRTEPQPGPQVARKRKQSPLQPSGKALRLTARVWDEPEDTALQKSREGRSEGTRA